MSTHEPSLKIMRVFLDPDARNALSLPLVALITGALSQVETTIELTNRVCDSVFNRSSKNDELNRQFFPDTIDRRSYGCGAK
jgi:hypothetical protein